MPMAGRLFIAVVVSAIIILTDSSLHYSKNIRKYTDTILAPVFYLASLPHDISGGFGQYVRSRHQLAEDNRKLQETLMLLKSELLKYRQLKQENRKLRALLESPIRTDSEVAVAEIMSVATDPFEQQIIINKGNEDKVFPGQPLIGEDGIIGQITSVSNGMSRALLLTDRRHAIPVRIVRNDIRAVVSGTGRPDELVITNLPRNSNVKVGDLLVTSGLGGKFPSGYPVGRVVDYIPDNGTGFAEVRARPVERLSRLRFVLLIWPSEYITDTGEHLGRTSVEMLKEGKARVR